MNPFGILSFALRRAWDEWISVVILSSLWLAAQVLILPGPPATAALFAMARQTREGTYWNAGDAWRAFVGYVRPAWKWALPNILVIGLALYNLSTFWNVPGAVWAALRVIWLLVLLGWLGLNLFYWPLWLSADDRSLRNTYANCGRFWLLHPGTAAVLFAVCLVIGIASISSFLPVVLGAVFWIALVSETAVRLSLAARAGVEPD